MKFCKFVKNYNWIKHNELHKRILLHIYNEIYNDIYKRILLHIYNDIYNDIYKHILLHQYKVTWQAYNY